MAGENNDEALILRLLGEPRIHHRSASLIDLLAGKEQALLIYLACQPQRRFSREHLATLLWGETPESRARYNLRRALWNLRRGIDEVGVGPDECLSVEGSWIGVPPAAPFWLDTLVFEQILQKCFQDVQSRSPATPETMREVRSALDLYDGSFLSGFSILHAPGFEEWHTGERERFVVLRLRALHALIQGFVGRGEREEAISACHGLLTVDPLQEDTHRLLLHLYWETGQRSQALRQHLGFRDLLLRELGVEPLEETQDLYHRILQFEPPATQAASPIPTSRLSPPTPAPESLLRPRLFSLLDRGLSARLTLLSAPSGYGKTTLVAQWLAARSASGLPGRSLDSQGERGLLFAWYTVSEDDNTSLAFIEGLVASLSRLHSAVGRALREGVRDFSGMLEDPRRAAALVVSALGALPSVPFVIVLDDLHHLTNVDCHKVFQYLFEYLPANGHLYLLTQADPPLPLARLRVKGRFLEIRTAELRFTDEEAVAFLERAPGVSLTPAEIAELAARAEGWVAPLWLAANALSRFAASLDDVWEGLFAYLREEVLATLLPDVRDFLLRSAVLEAMTPELCEAVLGVPERAVTAIQWLAEMEQRNLFLARVEIETSGEVIRYVYHPIFLAFLRAELKRYLQEADIGILHRRAGGFWEQRGELERAFSHYRRSCHVAGMARVLERNAPSCMQEGRLELLDRWLAEMGSAVWDQYPHLVLVAARVRQAERREEEARGLYLKAAAGFGAAGDRDAQGDSFLGVAELGLLRGRYREGIEWAQKAISCWRDDDADRRADALSTLGCLAACTGNFLEAEVLLDRAKNMALGSGHERVAFRVLRTGAWVAYLQGSFQQAMDLSRLAEQRSEQRVPSQVLTTFRNPVPAILREWGEGEAAWEATHRRLVAARRLRDWEALSSAHNDMGNLHLDWAQFAEAETSFREAITGAEAAGEDGLHRLHGEVCLVGTYFLQGRTQEGAKVAEAALRRCQARDTSPLELALARSAVALANLRVLRFVNGTDQLLEAYDTFGNLGVRYGTFALGVLLALTDFWVDRKQQAQEHLTKALAIAASEGYVQTIVTFRAITLPLMLFALRRGVEPRFVSQVLTRIGSDALDGIVQMAAADDPLVRGRAAVGLEVIGSQDAVKQAALDALERLAHDSDAEVRAVATQARHALT